MSEFIQSAGTTANNQLISQTTNLSVELVMPANFNQAVNDTVSTAMHQYLVNYAIGDWFTITNKNDAGDYVALAAANIEEIRNANNKRVRPTRTSVTNP